MDMYRTNRVLSDAARCQLETRPQQHATTCLTYRDTASAPSDGSVQMERDGTGFNGGWEYPRVNSLTGSGLRSLFLAITMGQRGRGDEGGCYSEW